MKIIELNKTNKSFPVTAAIGVFDGLHKGHKKVLESIKDKEPSAVLTFYRHPRNIRTLQSLSYRLRNFRNFGINKVVVFMNRDGIINMSAGDFVENVIKKLKIGKLVVGSDFRMGHNRDCGINELKDICKKNSVELSVIEVVRDEGKKLSSTDIRNYVEHGDVPKAISLLGHDLDLHGIVVKGKGNGGKIGFKTANIKLSSSRTLPDDGIYVTRTHINGKAHPSVTFIGESPTIHREHTNTQLPAVETHIIDFDLDIYGQKISIDLLEKIRDIKKFPDLNELSMAISKDIKYAVKRLHSYK